MGKKNETKKGETVTQETTWRNKKQNIKQQTRE